MKKPKILLLDIETSPILARTWGLYDVNVSLNQIKKDWFMLSWSAKWHGAKEVLYKDCAKSFKRTQDKTILKALWRLLDSADVVVAQNGKKFDIRKINARFIEAGFSPPAPYRVVDTLLIARKKFGFTSNSLAYLAKILKTKHQKLEHKKFPGQELWNECLAGNPAAWQEMCKYNKHDVLVLEEVYNKLVVWDPSINYDVYQEMSSCTCGSTDFRKAGFYYTPTSKFQCYRCKRCGAQRRSRLNERTGKNKTISTGFA